MMGVPCKTRSCFGRSAFMRRPKPAAAIIAPTFIMTIYQRKIGRGWHGLRGGRTKYLHLRPPRNPCNPRLFRILSATLPFVPVARAWARAQAAAHVLGVPH